MDAVVRVVGGDFCPEGRAVVHVVEMGEFVEDDIVTQDFGDVHQADVEGDGAVCGAGAPASVGVGEATLVVRIAVELGVILETIGEILAGFVFEDFDFGVASALSFGVLDGELLADEGAIAFEEALNEEV